MPEGEKQAESQRNTGVDLERLQRNQAELKSVQETLAPKTKNESWLGAAYLLNIAFEFAIILAAPLIAAVFIGRWATERYGNKLYSVLILLIALLFSAVAIWLDIKKLSRRLKKP